MHNQVLGQRRELKRIVQQIALRCDERRKENKLNRGVK